MEQLENPQEQVLLRRSRHTSAFAHMGRVFLYHDLFGFIMEMSPDVLEFLACFESVGKDADDAFAPHEICEAWQGRFGEASPKGFVDVFLQFHCLVKHDEEEIAGIWDYVAVKSKWNVWQREDDGSLTFVTAWGERPIRRTRLTPAEARLWDSFDGERPLRAALEAHQPHEVEALVRRLAHHDVQALKLSPVPMSVYKGRPNLEPPYLTSTMPYPDYVPGQLSPAEDKHGKVSPANYYRNTVEDVERQFDHQETTLSHLLRRAHPALSGRSYGEALVAALVQRSMVPADPGRVVRILEVGAGLGFVAEAVCRSLQERGLHVQYEIVELSPALAKAQRARCRDLPLTVREGDVLDVELESDAYDLILSNEMIGDLEAVQLTHADIAFGADADTREHALDALGEPGRLIRELKLELSDAPETFYLSTGAYQFVERARLALAPGGVLFASEFGDLGRYPRLSSHLDHPELSIHFKLLEGAARALGLEASVEFVMDLIELDRKAEGFASTRSYFRALRAMLQGYGATLEKIGYTRTMLHELLATASIDTTRIGELHFDRIEDRLMGLVPHEFKALLARKAVVPVA